MRCLFWLYHKSSSPHVATTKAVDQKLETNKKLGKEKLFWDTTVFTGNGSCRHPPKGVLWQITVINLQLRLQPKTLGCYILAVRNGSSCFQKRVFESWGLLTPFSDKPESKPDRAFLYIMPVFPKITSAQAMNAMFYSNMLDVKSYFSRLCRKVPLPRHSSKKVRWY